MEKADEAKKLFNDFFSDVKTMKTQNVQSSSTPYRSPTKKDQDEAEYEYYDEEFDNEDDEDSIDTLYKTSMRLNSRRENRRDKIG